MEVSTGAGDERRAVNDSHETARRWVVDAIRRLEEKADDRSFACKGRISGWVNEDDFWRGVVEHLQDIREQVEEEKP